MYELHPEPSTTLNALRVEKYMYFSTLRAFSVVDGSGCNSYIPASFQGFIFIPEPDIGGVAEWLKAPVC